MGFRTFLGQFSADLCLVKSAFQIASEFRQYKSGNTERVSEASELILREKSRNFDWFVLPFFELNQNIDFENPLVRFAHSFLGRENNFYIHFGQVNNASFSHNAFSIKHV